MRVSRQEISKFPKILNYSFTVGDTMDTNLFKAHLALHSVLPGSRLYKRFLLSWSFFYLFYQLWHLKLLQTIFILHIFKFYRDTPTHPALIFHLMRLLTPDVLTAGAANYIHQAYWTSPPLFPWLSHLSLFFSFNLSFSIPLEIVL